MNVYIHPPSQTKNTLTETYLKINSKWITDLNVKLKLQNIYKREKNLYDWAMGKGLGKEFVDIKAKAQSEEKNDKLDFIKI